MIHQQQFPPKRPLLLHIARAPPFGVSYKYIRQRDLLAFCAVYITSYFKGMDLVTIIFVTANHRRISKMLVQKTTLLQNIPEFFDLKVETEKVLVYNVL